MLNVLSLFDGISCGQVALSRFGVPYRYFASEVEKSGIKITQKNFPRTIQIGDIERLSFGCDGAFPGYNGRFMFNTKDGYPDKMIYSRDLDLIIGGPPCQGFSYAGKMLNFEDERSKLFFEYERILKGMKPKFFVMENVKMKKEWQDIITDHLFGVEPIFIDSQDIGAQQRKRNYWVGELQSDGTYKKLDIPLPTGPGKIIDDILQPFEEIEEKYFLNEEQIEKAIKNCKGKIFKSGKKNGNAPIVRLDKALCLTAKNFGKSNRQVNRIIQYPRGNNSGGIRGENGKVPCITTCQWKYNNYLLDSGGRMRVFTEIEQERLQCLPDNYTEGIPTYLREFHIGNGFHVDTMEYILSFIMQKLGKSHKNQNSNIKEKNSIDLFTNLNIKNLSEK